MSRFRVALLAAGLTGGWLPVLIASGETIAVRVDELTGGGWTAGYSTLIAMGWLVALIAMPVFGRLSDAGVRRGQSRRLHAAIGVAAMAAAGALLASAATLPTLAIAWLIAQLPTALVVSVVVAWIADLTPVSARGWASGVAAMAAPLALLLGAALVLMVHATPELMFIIPTAVGILLTLPALIVGRSPRPSTEPQASTRTVTAHAPRGSLRPLLIALALAMSGVAVGRIYVVPLMADTGSSDSTSLIANASIAVLVATLAAIIASLITGRLAASTARAVRAFIIVCLVASVPLVVLAFGPQIPVIVASAVVVGMVAGSLSAAAYAIYLHRHADGGSHGSGLGFINAAETVPYVAVPLVASLPQALTGQPLLPVLFMVGAGCALAAAVFGARHLRLTEPNTL